MSTFNRLYKKLSRQGISATYRNQTHFIQKEETQAAVLLPEELRLEEKAVNQLLDFASVHVPNHKGHVVKACATPDFHTGSIAPVGCIVATTPDIVIPAAVGTDINCGMRLLSTGLTLEQAKQQQSRLEEALSAVLLHDQRDIPVTPQSFYALFDEGLESWLDALPTQGLWKKCDFERLHLEINQIIGNDLIEAHHQYAPEAFFEKRDIIRPASLGTVGSGNHFVELQVVDEILDRHLAYQYGLKVGEVVIMIHTGSRDVGFYIGNRWIDRAKAAWPKGLKHPESALYGLADEHAQAYMQAMGVAARYAWINRISITELVRQALQVTFKEDCSALVVDTPHNIILPEESTSGMLNVHRKGATPAHAGKLALIPGSMGDYSYVAMGMGNADWLSSCSHGAGRATRRQAMRAKNSFENESTLPHRCITLNEDRRIEEAPSAYKSIMPVIQAQEDAGLIHTAVRLKPWITFKA